MGRKGPKKELNLLSEASPAASQASLPSLFWDPEQAYRVGLLRFNSPLLSCWKLPGQVKLGKMWTGSQPQ